MSNRTPPLPALRAFASLVRLGTISACAGELNLTQGAVSHQIRALENFLGVQLVERIGRRMHLTEHGRIYGYQVRQALNDIVNATESTKRQSKTKHSAQVVRIAVLPSFAQGWLLPRLPDFCRLYPEVRLVLHGSMEYVDLNAGTVDCAIRFGHGNWAESVIRPLMSDSLLLVASPKLLGKRPPKQLAQLMQLPMLHSVENWASWSAALPDATALLQRPQARMEFTDSTHLLEAARLDLGVALTRRSIAHNLLHTGELVQAFPHECVHHSSYYVLTPTSANNHITLDKFIAWLQVESAKFMKHQPTSLWSQ